MDSKKASEPQAKATNYKEWYKNPTLSDIIIRYGPECKSTFVRHRIVLANGSELFKNILTSWKFVSLIIRQYAHSLLIYEYVDT